jgi:uncharacterized protein (TIGR02246 family)
MLKYKKTIITTLTLICSMFFVGQSFARSYADDRAEIENLAARYMFAFDSWNADDFAATFTEDGVLVFAGGTQTKTGRREIREWIQQAGERTNKRKAELLSRGQAEQRSRHIITNMLIDVKGDKATLKAYLVMLRTEDDGYERMEYYARYDDSLEYVNGEWLFSKRIVTD